MQNYRVASLRIVEHEGNDIENQKCTLLNISKCFVKNMQKRVNKNLKPQN